MPKSLAEIRSELQSINNHVEHIGRERPSNSDLSILAYAIHNLAVCVGDVAEMAAATQK